ncbi:MAG: hypothetical protein ACI8XO_000767 [Verrucomicrobiales bacterium]|jgi:hypothetical protein
MRKTFLLTDPKNRHEPPRVVEQVKADVRKYIKRERGKSLPDDVDFWDFDCRAGKDAETAVEVHIRELTAAIDSAAGESWSSVYIEILAKSGRRTKKAKPEDESQVLPEG